MGRETWWATVHGVVKSQTLLLLLLLSRFSRVRLCATPWTAAYQASPSMDSPGKNTGVGQTLLRYKTTTNKSNYNKSPTYQPSDCKFSKTQMRIWFQQVNQNLCHQVRHE